MSRLGSLINEHDNMLRLDEWICTEKIPLIDELEKKYTLVCRVAPGHGDAGDCSICPLDTQGIQVILESMK